VGILVLVQPLWTQKEEEPRAQDMPSPSLRDVLNKLPSDLHGFLECRGGMRTQNDPNQSNDASIAEARLQLELDRALDWGEIKIKSDFLYDEVLRRGNLKYFGAEDATDLPGEAIEVTKKSILDTLGVEGRMQSRSKYGAKRPKK